MDYSEKAEIFLNIMLWSFKIMFAVKILGILFFSFIVLSWWIIFSPIIILALILLWETIDGIGL